MRQIHFTVLKAQSMHYYPAMPGTIHYNTIHYNTLALMISEKASCILFMVLILNIIYLKAHLYHLGSVKLDFSSRVPLVKHAINWLSKVTPKTGVTLDKFQKQIYQNIATN